VHPTLTLALAFAAGNSAGAAAAPVVLARGVLRTMFLTRIRNVGVVLAAAVLLALAGVFAYPSPAAQGPEPPPAAKAVERPKATEADVAAAAEGNRRFALDLYARLRQKDGNLFFSPYSISTALAMTYAGARGDTATEMAKTLHFGLGQKRLHPAFAALQEQLNAPGKQRRYQLSVANALWGQTGFGFAPPFLALTRDHYGAGLREVDFRADTEKARQTINAWVESQTETRIKELLVPGVLTGNTKLVLTNAIFFRGDWARQFKKDETREELFYITAERAVKVPMMRQSGSYRYLRTDKLRALELPYSGGELAMLLLVPRQGESLAEVERSLTADNLQKWSALLKKQDGLIVGLPRFEVTDAVSLQPVLSDMGMPLAFLPPAADFSGMAGRGGLFISAVVHKAFVKVNEEGTEAAAATAAAIEPEAEPPGIRADRPFLFLIRDTRSGSILFLGRVVNPRAE
jgi:serpin B